MVWWKSAIGSQIPGSSSRIREIGIKCSQCVERCGEEFQIIIWGPPLRSNIFFCKQTNLLKISMFPSETKVSGLPLTDHFEIRQAGPLRFPKLCSNFFFSSALRQGPARWRHWLAQPMICQGLRQFKTTFGGNSWNLNQNQFSFIWSFRKSRRDPWANFGNLEQKKVGPWSNTPGHPQVQIQVHCPSLSTWFLLLDGCINTTSLNPGMECQWGRT